jgi:hypothetical protein
MKILLRINVAMVAVATVVAILFSSHVVSCQGNVVRVGNGHAQQHDSVNDDAAADSDTTNNNVIMMMSTEEDNQWVNVQKQRVSNSSTFSNNSVVRGLQSLLPRGRVNKDKADDSTNHEDFSNTDFHSAVAQ